jgi:hypothetical protein
MGLTIHSSRTRFVTSNSATEKRSAICLHYAGRLNSGVMRGRANALVGLLQEQFAVVVPWQSLPLASATSSRAARSVWEVAPMTTAPLPSAKQALAARSPSRANGFSPPAASRLRIASAARLRRLSGLHNYSFKPKPLRSFLHPCCFSGGFGLIQVLCAVGH